MNLKRLTLSIVLIFLLVLPMIFAFPSFVTFESDTTTATTTAVLSVTAFDLNGMDNIEIRENGNKIMDLPCAGSMCVHPYLPIIKTDSGTFVYQALARNNAGDIAKSDKITITFFGLDTQPPQYSNIVPTSPYTITYDQQPFALSVDWTDDTTVQSVVIAGDFTGSTTQSGNTYTYTVNNQNIGTYNWYMRATDIDGEQAITPTQTLIITKADPDLHLFLNTNENSISVLRDAFVDILGTSISNEGNLEIKENSAQIALGLSPLNILARQYTVPNIYNIELIYAGTTNFNSDTVSYQITVTDDAPVVNLLTPADSSLVPDLGTVDFTYSASDDISLVSCELIVDSTPTGLIETAPFTFAFTTPLALGPHTWTVECIDDYSQITTPSPFSFTLQNMPPQLTNIIPTTPQTSYTINNINFQVDVADPEGTTLDVEWYVDTFLQSGPTNYPTGSTAPFSYLFDTEKTYIVEVVVTDQDSYVSNYQWTINSIQIALTGTVTDGLGPLPGVTIDVEELGVPIDTTTTAAGGTYSITDLAPSTYDVTADLAGYYPVTKQITLSDDAVLDFFLVPNWCTDADGDGVYVDGGLCGVVDCDDTDDEVYPGATEICDGIDNDCDTNIDGMTRTCGTNVGACQTGTETCTTGTWGSCIGCITPTYDICGDNIDNDCDGVIDETCYPEYQYTLYIPGTIDLSKDETVKLIFPDSTAYYTTLQALSPYYIKLSITSSISADSMTFIVDAQKLTDFDLNNDNNPDLAITFNKIENGKANIFFDISKTYEAEDDDDDDDDDRSYYSGSTSSIIDFAKDIRAEVKEMPAKIKGISSSTLTFFRNQEEDARHAAAVAIFLLMLAVIAHFTKRHWDKWI